MAYVIKVKVEDVEKALVDVRPNHRLIAVCSFIAYDPVEHAEYERKSAGQFALMIYPYPMLYDWRDLYFEEVNDVWPYDRGPAELGLR